MWDSFEPGLQRPSSELDKHASTPERVQAALPELLPGGQAVVEPVSVELGTSARTLQRRLKRSKYPHIDD